MSLEQAGTELGTEMKAFDLPGVDGRNWSLADARGEKGTLVMFICNHCPYVVGAINRIVRDADALAPLGVKSVAICSNDANVYPEDSFDNMKRFAQDHEFRFPYLFDETQSVARGWGAVCTPDFFGFNSKLELQYRGRLDASRREAGPAGLRRDLYEAMRQMAKSDHDIQRDAIGRLGQVT